MIHCNYCASPSPSTSYDQLVHKVDNTFGPFSLAECPACGSLNTVNPPSADRLGEFYRRYEDFRPEWYNAASSSGALAAQYNFYAKVISQRTSDNASWIDIGAGHGEVASIVVKTRKLGMAADIGPRPSTLSPEVPYRPLDMNIPHWSNTLSNQFDHVFSVAVWEHVLNPFEFARECMSLVAPGGTLTLICPDYGSLARRLLNQRWPYFEPGEHISIPTIAGARQCLSRVIKDLALNADIAVSPISVGYSIRYVLDVLRLKPLAAIVPPELSAPLPTGLLIATVQRS